MYDYIDRVVEWANYIVENKTTIRACAKHFDMSKSTIHFDLKYKLPKINASLYMQVREILIQNFEEKHLRGGESTKQKYLHEKTGITL